MKIFTLILGALLWVAPAHATTDGIIKGTVLWKADGATTARSDVTIQLTTYRGEKAISAQRTKTNKKGNYRFTQLDRSKTLLYEVSAIHQGVNFKKPKKTFGSDKTLRFDDFTLYPFTSDPKDLVISEILLFEFGQTDILKINHSLVIVNQGELTYDGRGANPLQIPLTKGGFQLHFLSGVTQQALALSEDRNSLELIRPVAPGPENELRLEFNYLYQYETRSIEFVYPWQAKRVKTTVALIDQDHDVEGSGLKREPPREQNGSTFYFYGGGPYEANEELRFTLHGLPLPGDQGKHAALLGIVLIFASGLLLAMRKSKAKSSTEEDRKTIALRAWEQLETQAKKGEVTQEEIEEEKAYWKNVLIEAELEKLT